ncbi:MAG: hypothetical protein IJM19_05475, partial [Ruminococcus sp.]|nr:hypothetical protein [Ruminococcus sp.]
MIFEWMYFICICGFSEDVIEFLDMTICGGWILLYDTDLCLNVGFLMSKATAAESGFISEK